MSETKFQRLVDKGNQVGEVISVSRFLVKVRGLQPINLHALVMFEDGSKGYVHHVYEDYTVVLHLGTRELRAGMIAVLQHAQLLTRVGKNYIGRVVSVLGEPLDDKGAIASDGTWPIFHEAPMLYERKLLDKTLETGITTLDILFSIVRGQRMALLGDSKTGKSSLATQLAIHQSSTDIITIYVLISKRRADVIELIDRLERNGAMDKTIVIVATMFESLVINYLAPYVGAAMGEYFWQHLGIDTLVIYDDLTSHAMAYREISLIAGVSPGRDSYPGDMFYTHSSLIERAGRLERNGACQTILPVVYAPNGDITAYLPTNVMSMTDGQWILDVETFRERMRPAINTGLSVTRVGTVGQNQRQKALAVQTYKVIAAFKQAEEYAHFGSELSPELQVALQRGKDLYKLLNQVVGETYSICAQQLLLDIVLNLTPGESVDIDAMKQAAHEYAERLEKDDSAYEQIRDEFKNRFLVQKVDKPKASTPPSPPTPAAEPAPPKEEPKEPPQEDTKDEKPNKSEGVKEEPEKDTEKDKDKEKDKKKKKKHGDGHLHKDQDDPGTVYEPDYSRDESEDMPLFADSEDSDKTREKTK